MSTHFKPSALSKPKAVKGTHGANRIRIIGGIWRSRVIDFAGTQTLRPTANRVRETLFNWLGQTLHGKRCLDLFSGSGALGFEASSRGSLETVMLELDHDAVAALKSNQQKLAALSCRIVAGDALKFLATSIEKFDIVFVDPPFASNLMPAVLQKLPSHLFDGACVYVEWSTPIVDVMASMPLQQWEITKQGRAGAVHFALLKLLPDSISIRAEKKHD
jgi:16S rRNA (guanine966-N2)-methyltransferase